MAYRSVLLQDCPARAPSALTPPILPRPFLLVPVWAQKSMQRVFQHAFSLTADLLLIDGVESLGAEGNGIVMGTGLYTGVTLSLPSHRNSESS